MNDINIEDLIDVWTHDIEPPADIPRKYNAKLEFTLPTIGLTLVGSIAWNAAQARYEFHFQNYETSEPRRYAIKYGFLVLKPDDYLLVRGILRERFGLFTTSGIYDETDPPKLPHSQDFYVQPQETSYH